MGHEAEERKCLNARLVVRTILCRAHVDHLPLQVITQVALALILYVKAEGAREGARVCSHSDFVDGNLTHV